MKENMWQMVQDLRGGTLQLADLQTAAAPSLVEKFSVLFGESAKENVSQIIEVMKGEWPA